MNKTLSDLQTALKAAAAAKDADGDTHANGMNNVLTEQPMPREMKLQVSRVR